MAATPPQPQQPHCEPPSRQTFGNTAVRHRGMGRTLRPMRRRTAFHLSLTRRIFGGWRTSFPCSTTQPSQHDSRCKSCECILRCSQLQEVVILHSGTWRQLGGSAAKWVWLFTGTLVTYSEEKVALTS